MTKQKAATLRVCSSCEWIYKGYRDCPQCGFGSYGARWVYGNKAYGYAKTQKPWINRKISAYVANLVRHIKNGDVKPTE